MIRKDLGGYFPEEYDKQEFFISYYSAISQKEEKKRRMDELKALSKRGGR